MDENSSAYKAKNLLKLKKKFLEYETKKENIRTLYETSEKEDLLNYFTIACANGDLDSIKQLIFDFNVDITNDDYWAFNIACAEGQLEVIKYLTSSADLKEKIDPSFNDWKCINFMLKDSISVSNKNFIIPCIDFFINYPNPAIKFNLHLKSDFIFDSLLFHKQYDSLSHLIIECNLDITEDIKRYMSTYSEGNKIQKIFDSKKLKISLGNELNINDTKTNSSKLKI